MPPKYAKYVGRYIPKFNTLTGQSIPCGAIYQSPGLLKHVTKHHPGEVNNISKIPDVISSPDYIGHHPKEPDSIELVKCYGNNVQVCVKLDQTEGYLYVASVFEISSTKLNNRLFSGRLKKF